MKSVRPQRAIDVISGTQPFLIREDQKSGISLMDDMADLKQCESHRNVTRPITRASCASDGRLVRIVRGDLLKQRSDRRGAARAQSKSAGVAPGASQVIGVMGGA
jgi:hypothetical protein